MAEKTILGRIIQKHDIEANWNLATDFIPKQGEIIVYDIDENYTYERFKIGDGVTNVNDLPFASVTPDWSVNDPNAAGYIENRTHWIGTAEAPLTFDEDMTGKEVVEMGGGAYFVKMSDVPKTAEELIGSTLIIKQSPEDFNDYSGPIFELVIDETNIYKSYESDTGSMISVIINYNSGSDEAYVASVWGDLSKTGLPLSDGVYFIYVRSGDKYEYAHSLSCLTGPQEVVHKLDKKYLPDFISTVNGQTPDTNGNVDVNVPTKTSELTNDSEYQTAANVNTLIKNATISTSQLINGDSVDKLYLDGKFHIGSASSNKTFRLPADAITIEYSNDGGSTWKDYGNTAAQKEMLFDESMGYTWYLGKKTDKTQTTNDMLRVTISNVTDRYIGVKQVYHYASYNGQGLVFDLEYSTLSAPTTFVKVISDGRLRGWYGHNMYNFNQRTIGASNATTSAIRLTYKMNEINNSYASSSIKDIRFFGDNVWTAPADNYIGNMLKLNTPYKFIDDNTIDFPGTVDVNALKVNGTDISETYATKAEVEALVAKIEELMASI